MFIGFPTSMQGFRNLLFRIVLRHFHAMASQTDLKTLMEFTGHTQVSTVLGSYVFATSESMKSALNGMDKLRPTSKNAS